MKNEGLVLAWDGDKYELTNDGWYRLPRFDGDTSEGVIPYDDPLAIALTAYANGGDVPDNPEVAALLEEIRAVNG